MRTEIDYDLSEWTRGLFLCIFFSLLFDTPYPVHTPIRFCFSSSLFYSFFFLHHWRERDKRGGWDYLLLLSVVGIIWAFVIASTAELGEVIWVQKEAERVEGVTNFERPLEIVCLNSGVVVTKDHFLPSSSQLPHNIT